MKTLIALVKNAKYTEFCDEKSANELSALYGCSCAPERSVGSPCALVLRDVNLPVGKQWHQPMEEWFTKKYPTLRMSDFIVLYRGDVERI